MPVFATRKFRDLAAALMLLAGITHFAQLWFYNLSGTSIFAALFGLFYFLLALGLAGKSRFSLWLGIVIPGLGVTLSLQRELDLSFKDLTLINLAINLLVVLACGYTLYRTRHSEMD